jgi:polar amino acid transport system permease protein/polar amino acid transport system substrate-binding protein
MLKLIRYSFIILLVAFVASTSNLFAEKKVLRWAADAESGAPYVFQDKKDLNTLIGFEADIIRAIAKELDMDEVHVQNEWDGLVMGLDRMDYDLAINGIEITEDRKEVVNFSDIYYLTYQQLTVRRDQEGIFTMADLTGKKVGTLDGSLAERMLRTTEGIDVRTYDSEIKSYNDLEFGRLEAVLIDHPVALYYAGWHKKLKMVGQPIGEVSYGIVMRKADTTLLRQVNGAIKNLKKSGKLREILEKWNMWNFMMAKFMDDENESNVRHTGYLEFMESQGQKTTFADLIERYISLMPTLGKAALTTIGISLLAMILAIGVGLTAALMRVYAPKPISLMAIGFIEVVRGTPLLIQLYFIFYALPVIGIQLSPFLAAIIGLGFNYGAYEAENYRAGLFSVPRGQMEAAISLGMTRSQAIRHIIIPQAIRLVIPPVTNDFISLLKDSSLVSVITMVELTKEYNRLASIYYDYIGLGILVAGIYLLIGLPFVRLAGYVEKVYAIDKKSAKA